MEFRTFLPLLPLFLVACCDPWVCNRNTTTINLTAGSQWIPPAFQNSNIPLPYAYPQNCTWAFTVPNGQIAVVNVNMNLSSGDTFVIKRGDNYQHFFSGLSGDLFPKGQYNFYVPTGNATILLRAEDKQTNGTFSFVVTLEKLPTSAPVPVDQSKATQVFSLSSINKKQYYFNSKSTYTFRTVMGDCNFNEYGYDNCLVYRGASAATGIFEAGLSDYTSGFPTPFKGETTVICFDLAPKNSYLLYTPMPVIDKTFAWYVVLNSACQYLHPIGTNDWPSYVTTYCPGGCSQYINALKYANQNAKLTIYTGVIGADDSNIWTTLNYNDAQDSVPQQIKGGEWKTYVAIGGQVLVTLGDSTTWSQASKRKGFFATPNYNVLSNQQNAATVINSSTVYNFKYHVDSLDAGTLQVVIQNADGTALEQLITTSNINSIGDGSANGVRMMISYAMANASTTTRTKGAFMSFEISDKKSASNYSFAIVFAFTLMMIC